MTHMRIIILAKAPIAGFAKTRLIPALGPTGAADLAHRMLANIMHEAARADVGPVELCMTPPATDSAWAAVDIPADIDRQDQGDGDLGARMKRACSRALSDHNGVILVGTDCPALDAAMIAAMARALLDTDAVLLPTLDGGYAALAVRRFHASLFEHITWSTDTVAAVTLSRISDLGWTVTIFPTVADIDEPADLHWLPATWGHHQSDDKCKQTDM